jgi:hypothetical protein
MVSPHIGHSNIRLVYGIFFLGVRERHSCCATPQAEWPTKVFQGVSLVSLWHEDDPTSCVIYPAVQERSRAMFAATDAALITRSHGVKEQRAIWV